MQMGDKIVVMNDGVVEQSGTPQEIYDKPISMFVADFIGSPSMNFLPFEGAVAQGADTVMLGEHAVSTPRQLQAASGRLALGVRPEHIALDDQAPYRGRVTAVEYLGTTQIVTLDTPHGSVKARVAATDRARIDDQVGLALNPATLTLFQADSGRALHSELNAGVL